jgi:hypothetical protein
MSAAVPAGSWDSGEGNCSMQDDNHQTLWAWLHGCVLALRTAASPLPAAGILVQLPLVSQPLTTVYMRCASAMRCRVQVLQLLIRLYEDCPQPDYTVICQCLMFLDDAPGVAKILNKLISSSGVSSGRCWCSGRRQGRVYGAMHLSWLLLVSCGGQHQWLPYG